MATMLVEFPPTANTRFQIAERDPDAVKAKELWNSPLPLNGVCQRSRCSGGPMTSSRRGRFLA
jgi:hypothetical protein